MEPRECERAVRAGIDPTNDALGIGADLEQLRRLEPPPQSSERRRQMLDSVLDQAASHSASTPVATLTRRRRRAPILAIAALAAAALLAVWSQARPSPGSAPRAASGAQQREAPALRLTTGRIEVGGEPLGGGARLAAGARASTLDEPARLVFADASVVHAQAHTTFMYAGAADGAELIELQQGLISLQVNPRPRRSSLRIETAELSAEVVGTRFDVMRDEHDARLGTTVRVQEGLVRVVAKSDGTVRLLAAGEHITVRAISASERGAEPEAQTPAAIVSSRRAEAHEQQPLSAQIRRQLHKGEVEAARQLLQRAERERAVSGLELSLLQAEADLAEHRHEQAKNRYLAIVTQHAGSPEAELALFAAAQLSSGQAGIDLLQRYVARYPSGRFAKEAHHLLQALDVP